MNVKGLSVDSRTRCSHYHTYEDIIAIRFYCCGEYYACIKCHEELAGHTVKVWPREEQSAKAVLCGNCQEKISIAVYKTQSHCPFCQHAFNPGCKRHFPYYFE